MNLPVEVIDAVREGRCLVFVGSRFTAESREASGLDVVDGRGLAKGLGWKRPRALPGRPSGPVTPSVRDAATEYERAHGRQSLMSCLQALVGAEGLKPTASHRFIIRHFDLVFTTVWDDLLEQAARAEGRDFAVLKPDDPIPQYDVEHPVLVRMRGGFDGPLRVTHGDEDDTAMGDDTRRRIRDLIRKNVVLFVGYRPDEEEFEVLFEQLTAAYGASLPRCHLAVAQGRIEDYQWQRWVWRGLLLFTADPEECTEALEVALQSC